MLTLAAAAAAVVIGALAGQLALGLPLGIGLVLGSMNGMLVRRSMNVGIAFTGLSLGRLMFLTIVALGLSALLGWKHGWLIVVGLAIAQLLLVGVAARELLLK